MYRHSCSTNFIFSVPSFEVLEPCWHSVPLCLDLKPVDPWPFLNDRSPYDLASRGDEVESIRRALSQLRGKKTQSLTMKITSCTVNITVALNLQMAALRFVNVSEAAINAMTVNSISQSTKDATEFGGPFFN